MLPALVAGVAGIYSVGKMATDIGYWNDYHKNTGIRPRYPLRTYLGINYGINAGRSFARGLKEF